MVGFLDVIDGLHSHWVLDFVLRMAFSVRFQLSLL